jgi:uncharacterized repeat protein (TIGR01451 family)
LTFTSTHSFTPTSTATATPTYTQTSTPTKTFTPSFTPTSTVTFTATNTYTFTATPTPTATFTATSTPTNTYTPTPGIQIQKSASENSVHMGDPVTYTLSLTVSGSTATNVQVWDSLPSQVTFAGFGSPSPAVPGQSMGVSGSLLSWNFPALSPGQYRLPYTVTVNQGMLGGEILVNNAQAAVAGGLPQSVSASVTVAGGNLVQVGVYNSSGELIETIVTRNFIQAVGNVQFSSTSITDQNGAVSVFIGGQLIASWDGSNASGNPVSNGVYFLKVENTNPFGFTTTITQNITVNRFLFMVMVNIYNEAGEIVRHLYSKQMDSALGSVQSLQLSGSSLRAGDPTLPNGSVTLQLAFPASTLSLVWDGSNDSGALVTNGQYYVEVLWVDPQAGNRNITQKVAVIQGASGPGYGQVFAQPNVLTGGQTRTVFKLESTYSFTLLVRVYDLSGELVAKAQGAPGRNQVDWDAAGLASGVYIAVVDLSGPNGLVTRQSTRLLVRH